MKWRFLLVDDEDDAHNILDRIFRDLPDLSKYIEVQHAYCPCSAISKLQRGQFDLLLIDIKMPIVRNRSEYGQTLEAIEKWRGRVFTTPMDADHYPNAGFWLAAYALDQFRIPKDRMVIYTRQVAELYEPFMKAPALGLRIYAHDLIVRPNFFLEVIKEQLENRSMTIISHQLDWKVKNALALEPKKLQTEPVYSDRILGEERIWTMVDLFPITFIQSKSDINRFRDSLQAMLFSPVKRDLMRIYDAIYPPLHAFDGMLVGFKDSPSFEERCRGRFFSLESIVNRLNQYSISADLLELGLRSLVKAFGDRSLWEDNNSITGSWYQNAKDLFLHWAYMRNPLFLLLDWVIAHDGWHLRCDDGNLLIALKDKIESLCGERVSLCSAVANPLLESHQKCLLEVWENFKRDSKVNYDLGAVRPGMSVPFHVVSRDYIESVLRAIDKNRMRDGRLGEVQVAVMINETSQALLVVICHTKPSKILTDKERKDLKDRVSESAMSWENLGGLRLKIKRLQANIVIWYKTDGDIWQPLEQEDENLFNMDSFYQLCSPDEDSYLIYCIALLRTGEGEWRETLQ